MLLILGSKITIKVNNIIYTCYVKIKNNLSVTKTSLYFNAFPIINIPKTVTLSTINISQKINAYNSNN